MPSQRGGLGRVEKTLSSIALGQVQTDVPYSLGRTNCARPPAAPRRDDFALHGVQHPQGAVAALAVVEIARYSRGAVATSSRCATCDG